MDGKFLPLKDLGFATHDWGRVGNVCVPANAGAKQLTILEARLLPGKGHDFHKHPDQEEALHVLQGEVEQWVDREKRLLKPGDTAFVPANMVHASFNVGQGEARILAIFGPSIGDAGFEAVDMTQVAPWKGLRG
jgi:quercetin dioxygenase-like cupin family protein